MFTRLDYDLLHSLVFRAGYPGYKPSVVEIPNGDGKADATKRYAHVGTKYLTDEVGAEDRQVLLHYLNAAHHVAVRAAFDVGMPEAFLPDARYGALRVLEYPPGAISHRHEDFDLFTLMCFRDQPDRFASDDAHDSSLTTAYLPIDIIRRSNPQAHLGQLGEAIGLGKATPHEVLPSETVQRSIVYFAIPNHDSLLPPSASGTRLTVRDWLNERMARSRSEFKKYE